MNGPLFLMKVHNRIMIFSKFAPELNTENMNTLEDFQARGLYSPEYEHDACGIQKDYVSKNIL